MQLVIDTSGAVRCLYDEAIDLAALGSLTILRGSQVEPDEQGQWIADLSPLQGPKLGPFKLRSEALAAEAEWIEAHWLTAEVIDPTGLPKNWEQRESQSHAKRDVNG